MYYQVKYEDEEYSVSQGVYLLIVDITQQLQDANKEVIQLKQTIRELGKEA